jgi:poly(ADP-ribose) glycohydrolase
MLAREPTTVLASFVDLRAIVTGRALPLDAIRALVAAEPGLDLRLETVILPSVVRHAHALTKAAGGEATALRLHRIGRSTRTVISREEAAGWLAHMVLGSLTPAGPDHPHLDFDLLLSRPHSAELAKLRCVLEYFDRIADAAPPGRLEIERIATTPRDAAEWAEDGSPLTAVTLDASGSIEDANGHRQVDFANAYLGGGVLSGGCVQEEIRFAVAPELMVAMIVSPWMGEGEAIVLRGAERFSRTRGYGRSLAFDGRCDDSAPRASDGTPDVELTAIDAVDYRKSDASTQHTEPMMLRELAKARAGFLRDERSLPVATGNWGCGVFRGDPPRKAVLQWLAASSEGRAMRYFSFGDARVGDLEGFAEAARARFPTVGSLWRRVRDTAGVGDRLFWRVLAP